MKLLICILSFMIFSSFQKNFNTVSLIYEFQEQKLSWTFENSLIGGWIDVQSSNNGVNWVFEGNSMPVPDSPPYYFITKNNPKKYYRVRLSETSPVNETVYSNIVQTR